MTQMYSTLLGALLLGMFPVLGGSQYDSATLSRFTVAPPPQEVAISEHLSASGVVVMDVRSGQNVFARDARIERPMASLTKIMTAVLIAENHNLQEIVRVPADISGTPGNVAYLPPGNRFTVGQLLSALLITSANDAAITLARFHSGTVSAFVDEMNARALSLGMHATTFRNPEGLDHPEHQSSPQDVAWLTAHALKYPEIVSRMGKQHAQITSREGEVIPLSHTHALLDDAWIAGGKTGTTTEAGQCLVSLVEDGPSEYVVVLFGSNQRYQDMRTILSALRGDTETGSGSSAPSIATHTYSRM